MCIYKTSLREHSVVQFHNRTEADKRLKDPTLAHMLRARIHYILELYSHAEKRYTNLHKNWKDIKRQQRQ